MAFKIFETKDAVPAEHQATALALADGKFAIDEPEDTSALTTALDAERTKREAAEKLVKKATDDAKKAEARLKAASHGLTEEQLQQIRAEASKDAEDKLAVATADLEKERASNRQKTLGGAFKTLAGESKFLGSKHDDLLRLHGDEFDLTDDGKLMVKGKPGIDPKKHMDTIAKTRTEWVEGTKASGGGAAGVTTGGTSSNTSIEDLLKNPGEALRQARAAGKTE